MTELVNFAYTLLFNLYLFGVIFSLICWLFHTPTSEVVGTSKSFLEELIQEPTEDFYSNLQLTFQKDTQLDDERNLQMDEFTQQRKLFDSQEIPTVNTIQEKQKLMQFSLRKLRTFCSKASIPGYSVYVNGGEKERLVDYLLSLSVNYSQIVEFL
ncbi:MAG: hypothetical protein KME49_26585 [Brasilonema octagenarum HA4186-MV1]|jgi:hypothetical protein|nr:hypothetical protein [Brasilonema octagenarum HA4186-MV1]